MTASRVCKAAAIIAAAGSSSRMGGGVPKQYRLLNGEPVFAASCRAFSELPEFSSVVVSVRPGDEDMASELIKSSGGRLADIFRVVSGGETRTASVAAALSAVPPDADYILIHDGARPFVSESVIERVLLTLESGCQAVVPGVAPKNTVRTLEKTLDRSLLYEVQTPQGFEADFLREVYDKAQRCGMESSDDAGLAERFGAKVTIVEGDYKNIKITTPEDFPAEFRTGNGYDVHRLVPGRKLMLGCVEIPFEKGLLGHSDADVICHALADAMLGAAASGDIGRHFPDCDPAYEGMPGGVLLRKTNEIISSLGFTLANADVTLIAEKPKISPYADEMRKRVSEALGVPAARISIKATTEEGLGLTGGGLAMAAFASVLLRG